MVFQSLNHLFDILKSLFVFKVRRDGDQTQDLVHVKHAISLATTWPLENRRLCFLFYVRVCFAVMCVCAPSACSVAVMGRRGCLIPWN